MGRGKKVATATNLENERGAASEYIQGCVVCGYCCGYCERRFGRSFEKGVVLCTNCFCWASHDQGRKQALSSVLSLEAIYVQRKVHRLYGFFTWCFSFDADRSAALISRESSR